MRVVFFTGFLLLTQTPVLAAQAQKLTLEQSVQRAVAVAPEMKVATAEVGKQKGMLERAGAWPNPTVSLQADDNLKREENGSGYSFTEFSVSQPIPIGRLEKQRKQAEASVNSAEFQQFQQALLLEFRVAQLFHTYQLKEAKLKLAKQRLKQARHYQDGGIRSKHDTTLVRYLTPLEKMRLNIVLQVAKQAVELAEGEFSHASTNFRALLGIPYDQPLQLAALTPVIQPESFEQLQKHLASHPALLAEQQTILSSEAGIEVAEKERFTDPVVTIFRKNAFLGNRRQPNTGIMLSVQVPLWEQNNGGVVRARQTVYQAQARLNMKQRDLQTSLQMSYLHLGHLIKQAEDYRINLLKPAKQVFRLTRKGFDAGELNVLTLIDANNTYFDAQARYLTLLQEGWLELAMVRKSAGLSVHSDSFKSPMAEVKSL